MDYKGKVTKAGNFKNAMVTLKSELPSDMSFIRVTGTVMGGEGHANNIEFTLDDMRDLSEYKPIMVSY